MIDMIMLLRTLVFLAVLTIFNGAAVRFAHSAVPIMFQHIASSTNTPGNGDTGHAFVLNTEALPPNTVVVMAVTVPASVTRVTISDTLVGSWAPSVCTATGGTGNNKVWLFVQPLGSTGGGDTISWDVGSSNISPFQATLTFFENLSSSPVDGHSCSASGGLTPAKPQGANSMVHPDSKIPTSGGVVSSGSFTPSTDNDANGGHVIWSYIGQFDSDGSCVATGWTAASGFTLLNGDIAWCQSVGQDGFAHASEWETQATNGPVTASFTGAGESGSGDRFNYVAVALLVADNGATAPSTIHVASILHESSAGQTSPFDLNLVTPFTGNLRILATDWPAGVTDFGAGTLTGVSSSDGCSWTRKSRSGGADFWFAQGCSPLLNGTTTLTWTGSQTIPQYSFRVLDVINAQTLSFVNYAANSLAYPNCTAPTNDAPTITPGMNVNAGLAVADLGVEFNHVTGLASGAPSGANFDLWTFTNEDGNDEMENADGLAHIYFSSNATQRWDWARVSGTDQCDWSAGIFQ
jgi:hypothetical protein